MSQHLVGKSDIDALVTVGLAWGSLPQAEAVCATTFWLELSLDPSAAGTRFWRENYNCVVYGGDPDLMDEEERSWLLEEYAQEGDGQDDGSLPPYSYDAMPGTPSVPAGLRVIGYYSYQTSSHWSHEGPTPISEFIDALNAFGASLAGPTAAAKDLPWGLGAGHRDYFLRH